MKELLARLSASYENLSSRERVLLLAAGSMLLVLIVIFGVVNPTLSASARAASRVRGAEQELQAARRLHEKLEEINGRLQSVEQRIQSGPRGEIFTTLEELARQSAVKIDSMEPRTSPASEDYKETKVQVVLKGTTLAQFVNYLHRIDSAEQLLSIKTLRVRTRNDKPELLDVTFTVSSFEPI